MKAEVLIYFDDADEKKALQLHKDLRKRRFQVYLVKRGEDSNRRWESKLESAAARAESHILIFSSNTIDEAGNPAGVMGDVLRVLSAESHDVKIIPVRLDDRVILDERLSDLEWIELGGAWGLERLARYIEKILQASGRRFSSSRRSFGTRDDVFLVLAWDPEIFNPDEYGALVGALGDLARSLGAAGIERVSEELTPIGAKVGVRL